MGFDRSLNRVRIAAAERNYQRHASLVSLPNHRGIPLRQTCWGQRQSS